MICISCSDKNNAEQKTEVSKEQAKTVTQKDSAKKNLVQETEKRLTTVNREGIPDDKHRGFSFF